MKPVVIVVSTATKTFTETAVGGEEYNRRSFFLQKIYAVSRLGESLVQWAAAAIPAAFYPHIPLRRALTSAARGAAGESGGELSSGRCWTEEWDTHCWATASDQQRLNARIVPICRLVLLRIKRNQHACVSVQ